ncbi:hypothetical protein [[Phormidium] sp. ETS-05]|nr:hypothetical protein [[Phormidium] sp. ETS-05]
MPSHWRAIARAYFYPLSYATTSTIQVYVTSLIIAPRQECEVF